MRTVFKILTWTEQTQPSNVITYRVKMFKNEPKRGTCLNEQQYSKHRNTPHARTQSTRNTPHARYTPHARVPSAKLRFVAPWLNEMDRCSKSLRYSSSSLAMSMRQLEAKSLTRRTRRRDGEGRCYVTLRCSPMRSTRFEV